MSVCVCAWFITNFTILQCYSDILIKPDQVNKHWTGTCSHLAHSNTHTPLNTKLEWVLWWMTVKHTRTCSAAFDTNRYGHCVQTLAYWELWRKDGVKGKITGMRGIVNSHVALVCVDSVEQSLRCHPFNGQTTLKAYTADQNKRWAEPAGFIDDAANINTALF